ncbi:low molecular weight protein-tyrosine-phosphatase [Sneathiella limimaris]|uniref:low molecular weight protein-tyrosine-phosphatase n=1 Tax=Sneathiella limimaris TaxID=1964213 RepID=UPI001469BA20|nr:low molecular weight protein-tyrosine-phosphatase [Sneathiella limimaris]
MPAVLFVCLGNICRSPSAEAVFTALVQDKGYAEHILVDSAGTGAWHVGNSPDDRAQRVGQELGFDLSSPRARQVSVHDFQRFDYIVAMDRSNFNNLQRLCPPNYGGQLAMMLDFAGQMGEEVPDPYYGGIEDYYHVFDLLKPAAAGLLDHVVSKFEL